MFAEIVINIEAPLDGSFHYHLPFDLEERVRVGHLVEVMFGRRLAQGIVVGLSGSAPVPETKPIISLIEPLPVVWPYQIELARRLSAYYLTPLNACLRLMLPPGLTRWSDISLAIAPKWDGEGLRTDAQRHLVALLREKGHLRGRQIPRLFPKTLRKKWRAAADQLVKRGVLTRGTLLDAPKARPRQLRTATLILDPLRIRDEMMGLGRANKSADILNHLSLSDDPLPAESAVLATTGAKSSHLAKLQRLGLVERIPKKTINVPNSDPPATYEQPAAVGLAISPKKVLGEILKLRGAGKIYAALTLLAEAAQPVALSELYAETGVSSAQMKRLEKLDLIRFGAEEVWRDSLADRDFVPAEPPTLTHDQARIWGRLKLAMLGVSGDTSRPFLLKGVTGSGKTEIYMRAVDLALERGQAAIILVPEIALTPQTVRRFAARFPGRVAVLHSRLTAGERYDTWRRARKGMFDIIVGPRSALMTPFPDLGVIVLDEEHDNSYKQTPPVPPPYYHARDAAIELGKITGAAVILGSATPDLVSYHRAKSGRYELLELPRRVMGHRQRVTAQAERVGREMRYDSAETDPDDALTIPLPPIDVVDLRQELRAGNRSIFSRTLQKGIDTVLARREQAILFLNRRGTSSFIICRDCGHTLACPNCDTALTYHRPHLALSCHYCGHKEPQQPHCPNCNSKRIKYFGLGTEALEAQVKKRWPDARVVRWDRDTTAGRDSHETLLASFINHEADILVGTQMIAKGLDLPLVTLVGVISADVALGLPDYRTGERAFQVLTQVAGRAGRGLLGGRVVMQTYQPEHYAIQAASEHDYAQFFVEEIAFRTQHHLPPFRRMAKLVFSDPSPARAEWEAKRLAKALRWHALELKMHATEIVGPVPPYFARIDRRFRQQIIIRSAEPAALLRDFPIPKQWMLDIDPVSTL